MKPINKMRLPETISLKAVECNLNVIFDLSLFIYECNVMQSILPNLFGIHLINNLKNVNMFSMIIKIPKHYVGCFKI